MPISRDPFPHLSKSRFFAEFILSKNEILRFAQNDKGEGLRMTVDSASRAQYAQA
jgi:hypothetical protein